MPALTKTNYWSKNAHGQVGIEEKIFAILFLHITGFHLPFLSAVAKIHPITTLTWVNKNKNM